MPEETTSAETNHKNPYQEPLSHRVREGLVTGGLICIVGILIRFFAPVIAGKNDTLFLRTNALVQISLWIFWLGAILVILCFVFWLADGMLANRKDR